MPELDEAALSKLVNLTKSVLYLKQQKPIKISREKFSWNSRSKLSSIRTEKVTPEPTYDY